MVQHIEQLATELKFFRFCHSNVLERREVPVYVSRALHGVAALVPKYLDLACRVRSKPLESVYVEPLRRRVWSRVRVPNYVRAVAGKPGYLRRLPLHGNIVGVEHRKRRATHRGHDPVQLPVAQNLAIPVTGML